MRAFFAVDLPAELASEVEAVQDELSGAHGLGFVDPDQAHITLKFLGEVPEGDLAAVIEAGEQAVAEANTGPFELRVSDLGVFPSLEYISVVWAAVADGARELAVLHDALEARTTALGYDPEDHEFTPHVTLARMNDARGKETVQEVVRDQHPELGTFEVTEIRLKESHLTEDGPEYETVERFSL